MNYLSSSVSHIDDHYDVIIIGSGYGGAVAASRFARAGKKVCVLERGKEFQAGDFPSNPLEVANQIQVDFPEQDLLNDQGKRTGLYDFRVNDDLNVFMGCGLGGTSLINANVAIRPDSRVFADPRWPSALHQGNDPLLLDAYALAEETLSPSTYPDSFPPLTKLEVLKTSALKLNINCAAAPINVNFKDGVNAVGVAQNACVLCGDCITGCNFSAKNSLIMNYLPDAVTHGALLFTRAAVHHLEPSDKQWQVHYQILRSGKEPLDGPTLTVSADIVWLSAGALGSTEILLRSRENGLSLSPRLGSNFSGNADVLGFAYNCDQAVNGVGNASGRNKKITAVGPCITGVMDMRATPKVEDGILIQEGALPGSVSLATPFALLLLAKKTGIDTDPGLWDRIKEKFRKLLSLIPGIRRDAMFNTQTLLGMGHDGSAGRLYLQQDRVRIDWPGINDLASVTKINDTMHKITAALGGTFVSNPVGGKFFAERMVTVHPLGGCSMADSAEGGVVDHKGRVFSGTQGKAVHPGLYVSDGSVMSSSLGANPLLTITAISERACRLLVQDYGWTIDYKPAASPQPGAARKIGLEFDEVMRGYLAKDVDDYQAGFDQGEQAQNTCVLKCTLVIEDLDKFLDNPPHAAWATGSLQSILFGPEPLAIVRGEFRYFVPDPNNQRMRHMVYSLHLKAPDNTPLYVEGIKEVRDDPGFDVWSDTTTIFISVYSGSNGQAPLFAKGIVHIAVKDFMRQLLGLRVFHAQKISERISAMARFGRFFVGGLFDTYGGVVARATYYDPESPPRLKRDLLVSAPSVYPLTTDDGVSIMLTRYRGGNKGPVLLTHGLGVSSQIFTLDTIQTNLVEYLFANGYDVWLLDYRSSILLPSSETEHNGDVIAAHDYPVAVAKILAVTQVKSIQVVAHCFGSTVFFMSMLNGLKGVRSAVISQIATDVYTAKAAKVKAGLHLPGVLKLLGVESLNAYVDAHADWKQKLYDTALKFQPMQAEERCQSATCHRITFTYGNLYEHDQLNTATHTILHELFGVANIGALAHLSTMVRAHKLVDAAGNDIYLTHQKIKNLSIPMLFVHGAENVCYLPKSIEYTVKRLAAANGAHLYQRTLIPSYGHIDCIFGRNAALDVYPHILKHLDANLLTM